MIVTFHEAAKAELADAVAYYNGQTAGLGGALAREVRSLVARIAEHPEAGFPVRPTVRRRLLHRFPYSLLYNATPGRIRVLALMHHRREPTFWIDRS